MGWPGLDADETRRARPAKRCANVWLVSLVLHAYLKRQALDAATVDRKDHVSYLQPCDRGGATLCHRRDQRERRRRRPMFVACIGHVCARVCL